MPDRYGASQEEWDAFSLILTDGTDLLPVVADPTKKISPSSSLKSVGKTPSRLNAAGEVIGFPNWTRHRSSPREIDAWSREPAYGICVQTRLLRAVDIDVEDAETAQAIAKFVDDHLGMTLPKRVRPNSGKCLQTFRLPGEWGKRRMKVAGGVVEFLATGQQFVACSTHPSGVRYEWNGGLPHTVPDVSIDAFEALWAALTERFATEEPHSRQVSVRQTGKLIDMPDPVGEYLADHSLVLSEGGNGLLHVRCPWEDNHSTGETGDTSTSWLPAGTRGYPKGHFVCQHAGCQDKTDAEFLEAIGYVEDVAADFEVVEGVSEEDPDPRFARDKKGYVEPTSTNVVTALRHPRYCGMDLRFDNYRGEIMFAIHEGEWQSFGDVHYTQLRLNLEARRFKTISKECLRDAVLFVAKLREFDTAILWAESLVWDGVPRIDTFLPNYLGADPGPFARAVSRYLWSALAGRTLKPGVQADMVPIMVGDQGAAKSTSVEAMAPAPDFFVEVSLKDDETDLARKLRGKSVGEISELRGLHTKDVESIKAFITRKKELWIPKYQEFEAKYPRRVVFIGTTNQEEFLSDPSGHRRFLPFRVRSCRPDLIAADREQLWAEAVVLFRTEGVCYLEAEILARAEHSSYEMEEPWADVIAKWLDTEDNVDGKTPRTRDFLRNHEVAKDALGIDPARFTKFDEMRIAKSLRACGMVRVKKRVDGAVTSVWCKKSHEK